MPKSEKVKVNVKERVDDNVCDLSLSGLSEIPVREIASFKRVTILDLSSNRLMTLGKNFAILTRLVKIDLSKNQIRYLPEDFGLLRNLRHLDLYDNKLEHLPLSFGNLSNLRYLDLKGNPLLPGLAKIVGYCLTTKECQDSARNTVKFMLRMQAEAEKAKNAIKSVPVTDENTSEPSVEEINLEEKTSSETQRSRKSTNKKGKPKNKKSNTNLTTSTSSISNNNNNNGDTIKELTNQNNKSTKSKKTSNGPLKKSNTKSSTALTSIFLFFLLLAINILLIYMIMFKNPEIAEKLVELIPHQYRDWIVTKTEIFRIRVTDWISEFRTPPEEH